MVLEEIAMHDDDPADVSHEAFMSSVLQNPDLAGPVLGTRESISQITADSIRAFHHTHYSPGNLIVVAAGNVDHQQVVDAVAEVDRRLGWSDHAQPPTVARTVATPSPAKARNLDLSRVGEQMHAIVGGTGPTRTAPDRYAVSVLSSVLGGGMSSRLFHQVREERGLAYSVYTFNALFADDGAFGVYVGAMPNRYRQALEVIAEQFADVAARGIRGEELDRGKGQIRGAVVLGLEDSFARMSRLGKSEFLQAELPTIDEIHTRIDAVDHDQILAAAQILDRPLTTVIVGPFDAVAGDAVEGDAVGGVGTTDADPVEFIAEEISS